MIQNIYFILFSIVLFTACGYVPEETSSIASTEQNSTIQEPIEVKYSRYFTIDTVSGGFQRLTVDHPNDDLSEQHIYILVPKGTAYASSGEEEIISTPIESCGVFSSSFLGMFNALKINNTIHTVESKNYIYSPKILASIQNGNTIEVRNGGLINAEKLILKNPEVLFTAGIGMGIDEEFKPVIKAGIQVIQCYDWREDHPLAKAEWIKFFGALFDQEQQADSIFNAVESNYITQVEELAQIKFEAVPNVLLSNMYQDTWYMPGGNSYIAKLLSDARATYPWSSEEINGSLPLSFESIAAQSLDSDIWINAEAAGLDELVLKDARLQTFIDNAQLGVFHYSKKTNELGGNDYFEMGALRADLVLSDYIKMLHPTFKENVEFNFFIQLK